MNRREKLNWIKSEICPKLDFTQELDIDRILQVVGKFRVDHRLKINDPMTATVNEYGHLFINDIHVGQITNKIPNVNFDEHGYCLEEKILARSEFD